VPAILSLAEHLHYVIEAKKRYERNNVFTSKKGLLFVKQYFPQKSEDLSGSSMSGILALTLETQKLTRIEYIAIFETKISIGDVFACTPFIKMDYKNV
jgi:hypothetical protein